MPEIALNVAPRMRNAPQARLREILPGCDVLFGPGIPSLENRHRPPGIRYI